MQPGHILSDDWHVLLFEWETGESFHIFMRMQWNPQTALKLYLRPKPMPVKIYCLQVKLYFLDAIIKTNIKTALLLRGNL